MRKLLCILTLSLPALLGAETFNYGFCPQDVTDELSSGHGSGKNNDIEVMIRLSAKDMPQVAALKGSKITGINAKIRIDVERKGAAIVRLGSLEAEAIKKDCYFDAGWNKITFAEPIEIGDEDIYVGYRVNETQGSGHHPIVAANGAAPSGVSFINVALSGWQDFGEKGSVMLQAVIDGDASALDAPAATAAVYGFPQLVAPSAPFDATVSIKNLSSKPISNLTVDYQHGSIDLEAEVAPFAVVQLPVTLMTPAEESTGTPFVTAVTAINGAEVAGYASTAHLYVTRDVFTRIPLVEEWTGLTCVNCPQMFYYLEDALKEYNRPHTYVAHHAGFNPDVLTQPVDLELLFLFGEPKNQRNPALMYDRTYLPGETELIFGISEPSTQPFIEKLVAAEHIPALAEVNVEMGETKVKVHGRVSTGPKTADGKAFISAYLVEDDIVPRPDYLPQMGINRDILDGSPADLVDKFRHNGVIRANLTATSTGDKLEFDAEGYYSYEFDLPDFKADWNAKNMHVVAFIHRFDPTQQVDNYVLNSGDSKPFEPTSINEVAAAGSELKVVRGLDGSIVILTPVQNAEGFDLAGRRVDLNRPSAPGLTIVRATLPDGTKATAKIK